MENKHTRKVRESSVVTVALFKPVLQFKARLTPEAPKCRLELARSRKMCLSRYTNENWMRVCTLGFGLVFEEIKV